MSGDIGQAKKVTQVGAQMDVMDQGLENLVQAVKGLEDSIEPCLRKIPLQPKDTTEKPLSAELAPIADGLRSFNDRLRSTKEKIEEIRQRIEL